MLAPRHTLECPDCRSPTVDRDPGTSTCKTALIDLAIIPARAGSQGLPGKNIADLGGRPLIEWTVRAALSSGVFARVIVSTDGPEIAEAAQAAGAEIPFLRPPELATSEARSVDVVRHALDACGPIQTFALLQPTSPFRNAAHIREATGLLAETGAAALISVAVGKPLAWQFTRDANSRLVRASAGAGDVFRRQDAAPTMTPNGAIYLCRTDIFRAQGTLFPADTCSLSMGQIDSLDIDNPEDLALARAVVSQGLRGIDK